MTPDARSAMNTTATAVAGSRWRWIQKGISSRTRSYAARIPPANINPGTAAIAPRTSTSTKSCPTRRDRDAPMAVRTASSDDRRDVRATMRFATFAAMIRSTVTKTAMKMRIMISICGETNMRVIGVTVCRCASTPRPAAETRAES